VNDRVDRRAKSKGCGDNFVPWPDAGRQHAEMQRCRTGIHSNGMRCIFVLLHVILELRDPWACAEPGTLQSLNNLFDFCIVDRGGTENEESIFGSNGIERHGLPFP
jgi:hypothetical protein